MEEKTEEPTNLADAPYVSLATYRKTGAIVATPVWCAEHQGAYYVFSAGAAGKVKRLRNSARSKLAVCDVRGRLLGPWQDAQSEVFTDSVEIALAHSALKKKYGWQMWLADAGSQLTGKYQKRAYIRIKLLSEPS